MIIMGHYPVEFPPESYSRQLDRSVQMEERPYGYLNNPPSADTGNYDTEAKVSKKEYPLKHGRAV